MFENDHKESVKVYHLCMYNGNIQHNPLCVESCMTKEFPTSPRFSTAFFIAMQFHFFYEHTFVQQSALCAENPVFENVYQESVKV